ncbi:MAG: sensor domain-containing diguanylate cyclase [Syntrophus sp. (in: bacteria)]|nr:sensor domain-containing diguanylate cyclase [Syntrophus sp. (in: bacteria)]
MIVDQLFDLVDIGIVILDNDLKIYKWNRWMEIHSGKPAETVTGHPIFEIFPDLNNPAFLRSVKYVMNFGNFYFFSQKLHHYLFPFKPASSLAANFEYMQQSCNMGRLTENGNSDRYVYITVHDVTEVAVYEKTLLEMNMKDGLTGIHNRRYLENQLISEFKRHRRAQKTFSTIMLDIDFFKNVNDTYGHQCGDFILKSIAFSITSAIRSTDVFARYGGEEFACLLPETDMGGALYLAEQFRKKVEKEVYYFKDTRIEITISLGVAELSNDMESPEMLLKKADDALYEAKRTGRNKVVASQSQ